MGGTIALISRAGLVSKASDGKLEANMAAEVETLGALFATDTGKISEASVAEGTGDKAEGAGGKAEGAGGKAEGAGGWSQKFPYTAMFLLIITCFIYIKL